MPPTFPLTITEVGGGGAQVYVEGGGQEEVDGFLVVVSVELLEARVGVDAPLRAVGVHDAHLVWGVGLRAEG